MAVLTGLGFSRAGAAPVSGDAVVLVNSQSAKYLDFQHFVQPYLDNFGIPYRVQDISTNAPGASLTNYAVIIIGHSELDTNFTYLNTWAQVSILQAVANGTGLVNFDSDLSSAGAPRYPFVQDIFGFSYGTGASGTSVSLPATEPSSQMHYITARHPTDDLISFRSSLDVPGITVPAAGTALAWCGDQPLVAISRYGQGRAVQWSSYGWMVSTVLGPVDGLDDLVWRGVVWAARKPFVMRGLPHFVTMRVDDVAGPLDWLQAATAVGFKPFVGVFIGDMAATNAVALRDLATSGQATVGIHSFDCCDRFFYFDHAAGTANSDLVQSNNFYLGTQWFLAHGMPMSKVCATHYSEIGVNCFEGLKAWGIEYVPIEVVPGTVEYGTPPAPWLAGGPYRLYEPPQPGQVTWPTYYADWLTVPGHPEFDGQFFNIYSEVRDVGSCGDWCPNNDVEGSISRGTLMAKRSLDSMAMAVIFTHEWDIAPVSAANWQAIVHGITTNLASYEPSYVTLDYASQYVRATRTSRLVSSAYDPESGAVMASFTGRTDLDTQVYIFTGDDNSITNSLGTVPILSESVSNPVVVSGRPVIMSLPASRTNNAGTAAVFSVGAGGAGPLRYQWYWEGTNALSDGGQVSGARSATLTISNVLAAVAGSYTVVITNAAGSVTTAPPAVLSVVDPAILTQPTNQPLEAGATAVFSVAAGGTTPAYQWFKNGAPISGATTPMLTLMNVSATDAGSYSVMVSNVYGSILSSNATLAVAHAPTANDDVYSVAANAPTTVAPPGVLGNDAVEGVAELAARLISGPSQGMLALQEDGGFTYSPLTNYVGTDSFVYEAVNGPTHSEPATVTLSVTADGVLFGDDFARLEEPGSLSPWLVQSGDLTVSDGALRAGTNMLQSYGFAYITNSWTNYAVEGRVRFSSPTAWGGGIGGRLNPDTGERYAAWVYPDASPGGGNELWLIKFQTWTSYGYMGSGDVPMEQVSVPAVGTNWHDLKIAFHENQIAVYWDGARVLSVLDAEAQTYADGGVSAEQWAARVADSMLVESVVACPLVVQDSYQVTEDGPLTVAEVGVLGNDTAVYPTNLATELLSGVAHGNLALNTNGGFTYSPVTDYTGMDSFTYQAIQGEASLGTATVTITVAPLDPKIVTLPLSSTNNVGTTATFSAAGQGTPPLGYQWFWNETNRLGDGGRISGAGSATLTISNVLGGDQGSYTVVVTNPVGSATSVPPATLMVIDPVITEEPVSRTNLAGTTATFSVGATGTPSLAYQWFRNRTNSLSDGGKISGAQGATLVISNALGGDSGSYNVVVSNQYGSVTSRVAELVFIPQPTVRSVRAADGVAVISWSSVAGQLYRLQYKDGLGSAFWRDMIPDILATGPITTVTNATGGAAQRFYRVMLVSEAAPPFAITSLRLTNGIASVTWNSVAGQVYRLQYKNGLTDTTWRDALPDVLATGPTTTLTNALGGDARRFYRVMLVETGVSRPVIKSISVTNGVVTVAWSSVLNQSYRLQYKAALGDAVWKAVVPDVNAAGPTTLLTQSVAGAPRRCYRVAVVP